MDRRPLRHKKNNSRNARPYDRPNQSILGKVASKVKGLLNPSWIFNVSQWMSTPQEEPGSTDSVEEESADEEDVAPQSSSTHGSKRPRLRLHEPGPSILSEGTQTWLDTPSSSNLFNQGPRLPSTVTQNTLMENKESAVIMNGDDHSENSEGSASTSGCSSLVSSHKERSNCLGPSNLRLSESALANLRGNLKGVMGLKNRRDLSSPREGLSPNANASRLSMWSGSGGFSPAAKFHRSPSVANSSQPGFNVSAFVGPSKVNQQIDRKVSSPFYQGKTAFGGASSTRRMPVSVAPYQVEKPLRNQIKVRSNQPEDSLEGMSSAAKRILMTLEKMSSPVTDAKKIPNTNKSPVDLSLYLMPPKHRSNVVSTPIGSSKGPPIANISTISKLTTLKSCGMRRFQNSSMESIPVPSEDKTKIPLESFQEAVLQMPALKSGGGKMRSKLTQQHQSCAGNNSLEQLEAVSLPDVPLPISTLPTFSFGSKSNKITSKSGNDFVFSNPIEVLPKATLIPVQSNIAVPNSDSRIQKNNTSEKQTFTFSSPIEHELPSVDSSIPSGVFTTNSSAMWSCSSCFVRNSVNQSECLVCQRPRSPLNPTTPPFPAVSTTPTKALSAFSSNFTNPPSTWECSSCWIRNPMNKDKCMACETPKAPASALPASTASTTNSTNKTTGFSSSITNLPSTWECSSCWVRNPVKDSKCLACEAPRPGAKVDEPSNATPKSSSTGFGISSSGSSGFFSSALISSTGGFKMPDFPCEKANSTFSLIASAKSSSSPVTTTSNGKSLCTGFKLPDWECDTCLVRNSLDKTKCSACETLRPSKGNMTGFKDPESFKFNSPLQNSPMTLKLNSLSTTSQTTTATATFTFGTPNSTTTSTFFTPVSNSSSLSNNLGSSEEPKPQSLAETPTTKQSVPEFKFETPKMPLIDAAKPEIPVINLVDKNEISEMKQTSLFGTPVSKSATEVATPSTTSVNSLFKITPTVTSASFSSNSVENKWPLSIPSNEESSAKSSQPLDTTKISEIFTSGQSKNIPVGGFNFKAPPSTTSVFSGFTTPTSSTGSKDLNTPVLGKPSSQSKDSNFGLDKKTDSPFILNASSPSLTSSFALPTSASMFKVSDTIEAGKTSTETPTTKSVLSALIGPGTATAPAFNFSTAPIGNKLETTKTITQPSSVTSALLSSTASNTTTVPTFNFSSTPIPFAVLTPNSSSQTNASTASDQAQPLARIAKSQDVKTVASVAPFCVAATSNTFTFGNPVTTTQSTPSSGFSFFAATTASTVPSSTPSLFTFGASSNTTQTSKPGGFTFKRMDEEKPNPVSSNSLNFSMPAVTSTSSIFKFNASVPASTSGFVFGAVKSEPAPVSAAPTNFAFGTATAPSTNSTFSGFQTNTSATPAFQFGSQSTGSAAAAPPFGSGGSGFSFGKTETANQLPTTQASATGFGCNTMQPMFGGTNAPAFGKSEKPAFNFGMPQSSTTPVFQFGEKKQATAPQFSFGTPSQETPAPGSFPTQFNINTPPSFNFGATSTQAGPFQFAASGDSQSSAPRKIRKAVRRGPRKD